MDAFSGFTWYTALAPVPLASFAGEGTAAKRKSVPEILPLACVHGGAVVVLACPPHFLQQQVRQQTPTCQPLPWCGNTSEKWCSTCWYSPGWSEAPAVLRGDVWVIESGIASQFGAHSGAKRQACARLSFMRCIHIPLYCHSPHTPMERTAVWPLPAGNGRNAAPPASSEG